jgi:hypothetical protein
MAKFHDMHVDPSSAPNIAEAIISAAEHLEEEYHSSEEALAQVFVHTYKGIQDGERTHEVDDGNKTVNSALSYGEAKGDKATDAVAAPVQKVDAAAWRAMGNTGN